MVIPIVVPIKVLNWWNLNYILKLVVIIMPKVSVDTLVIVILLQDQCHSYILQSIYNYMLVKAL